MANPNKNGIIDSKHKRMHNSLVEWKRRKKSCALDPIFNAETRKEQQRERKIHSEDQNDSKWQVRISYPGSDFNNKIILESFDCLVASGKQYFPIQDIKSECLSESSEKAKNGIIQPSNKRWR